VALGALLFAYGCSDDVTNPVETDKNVIVPPDQPEPEPVLQPLDEYYQEFWEKLFASPYDSEASATYLDAEIVAPGVYTGASQTGEPFTLEVVEADYYTQADLVAIDPRWQTLVDQLDLRLTFLTGTIFTPLGGVTILATASAGTETGVDFNFLRPLVDACEPENFVDPSDMAKARPDRFAKDQACEDDCQQTSWKPSPPDVDCPPGQLMDRACLNGCKAVFYTSVNSALGAFCSAACDAIDVMNEDLDDCHEEALESMGIATPLVFTGPFAPIAIGVADLTILNSYRRCCNKAKSTCKTAIKKAKKACKGAYGAAEATYEACALGCCHPPLNRDLIPWQFQ